MQDEISGRFRRRILGVAHQGENAAGESRRTGGGDGDNNLDKYQ